MIRSASSKDVMAIESLEQSVLGESLGSAFLLQEMKENPFSHIYVYEIKGLIVGYMSLRIVDDKADIINFVVDEGYQNKGIGTSLFKYMVSQLKSRMVESIILEVRVSNEKARYFYQKFNAKIIHYIEHYYQDGEAAYVLLIEVK